MTEARLARILSPGSVVGAVHSPAGLRAAAGLARGAVDFLELRVDAFSDDPAPLLEAKLSFPLIVTVRHPREGGVGALSAVGRVELMRAFLPRAALIDVELRSLREMRQVLRDARAAGIGVILSHHDFEKTPSAARLRKLVSRAVEAGADVFKIAAMTNTPRELRTLFGLLDEEKRIPLGVMGMGPLGKVSRLLLARTGSVLNYGFLDKSQVAGQWPAVLLKERIAELG